MPDACEARLKDRAASATVDESSQAPAADSETYLQPVHGWTCFFCGDTFMHERQARIHFGATPEQRPGCLLRIEPGERPLLRALRFAQDENARLRDEIDSEFAAEYHSRIAGDIRSIAAFKTCSTLRDVFNLYDHWEGRAIAAEARLAAIVARRPAPMMLSEFEAGMLVRYVPYHADGDPRHPDCEEGRVTRVDLKTGTVFVEFKGTTPQGCNPDQLQRR